MTDPHSGDQGGSAGAQGPNIPNNSDWNGWDFQLILKAVTGEYTELRKLTQNMPWFNFTPDAAAHTYKVGHDPAPKGDYYYYGFGKQFYGANLNPGAVADVDTARRTIDKVVTGILDGKYGDYALQPLYDFGAAVGSFNDWLTQNAANYSKWSTNLTSPDADFQGKAAAVIQQQMDHYGTALNDWTTQLADFGVSVQTAIDDAYLAAYQFALDAYSAWREGTTGALGDLNKTVHDTGVALWDALVARGLILGQPGYALDNTYNNAYYSHPHRAGKEAKDAHNKAQQATSDFVTAALSNLAVGAPINKTVNVMTADGWNTINQTITDQLTTALDGLDTAFRAAISPYNDSLVTLGKSMNPLTEPAPAATGAGAGAGNQPPTSASAPPPPVDSGAGSGPNAPGAGAGAGNQPPTSASAPPPPVDSGAGSGPNALGAGNQPPTSGSAPPPPGGAGAGSAVPGGTTPMPGAGSGMPGAGGAGATGPGSKGLGAANLGPLGQLLGADGHPVLGSHGELLGANKQPLLGSHGELLGPNGRPLLTAHGQEIGSSGQPLASVPELGAGPTGSSQALGGNNGGAPAGLIAGGSNTPGGVGTTHLGGVGGLPAGGGSGGGHPTVAGAANTSALPGGGGPVPPSQLLNSPGNNSGSSSPVSPLGQAYGGEAPTPAGSSGMPFMPPMGGMGNRSNSKKDRERQTWLHEDESVWGTEQSSGAGVIGRPTDGEDEFDVEEFTQPLRPGRRAPESPPTITTPNHRQLRRSGEQAEPEEVTADDHR